MTRLRHTNLVNALFYLPRPAVVLVPLLLKGLTLIVTLGVTAWLRSTWVEKPKSSMASSRTERWV